MKIEEQEQREIPLTKIKGGLPLIGKNKELVYPRISTAKLKELQEQAEELKDNKEKGKDEISKEIEAINKELKQFAKAMKPKEPLLFLIRDNHDVEIIENMTSGVHEIKRFDGKKGNITLPKSKLLTGTWGGEPLRFWVAYENEMIALPGDVVHDSKIIKELIESIIVNRGNLEVKKIGAWENLFWTVGIVIVLIIAAFVVLPAFFHVSLGTEIAKILGHDTNTTIQVAQTLSGGTTP